MTTKCYNSTNSINDWVDVLSVKYKDISLADKPTQIASILAIFDPNEIEKIKKASLISYGKTLGVITFEDACNKLKIKTVLPDVSELAPRYQKQQIALYKLSVIADAVNDGSVVGSRLCLKNRDLAYYMGNHFLAEYKDLLT